MKKKEIKILLREGLLHEGSLSNNDKVIIKFILGKNLNEADTGGILDRFIKLMGSSKRKFITAAAITFLMANPSFSSALEDAPDDMKSQIEQIVSNVSPTELSDKNSELAINFSDVFESGKYEVDTNSVYQKLDELKVFLEGSTDKSYKINITASESQVPNQAGFGVGELAKKRADVLKEVVENYIQKNNLGNIEVGVSTLVGEVRWDGSSKDAQKYRKDQFVRLDVYAAGMTPCELSFSKNDGAVATSETDYISYQQELVEDGKVYITPGSIPDRMLIRSGDKIVGDTGYFANEPHKYTEWVFVPEYVAELSEILHHTPNSQAIQGLESTTKTFNEFGELLNALLKDKRHDYKKDNRTEVREGLIKLKILWEDGQRDFIFYQMKSGSIDFKLIDRAEAGTLVVFSPVGKTGFKVNGDCN
tara:strand:+ start:107341 stop:108600 length:1260 start_codon:yes stop_codon:yes gene_type:complete